MASRRFGKILGDLQRHRHALDLDRDGLGEALLDAAAEVMERDFDRGVSPDGTPWDELDPDYLRWKQRNALTTQTGYLEGVMATEENFRGERFVSATEARSAFGTSEAAKQECDWFSRDRPFVGLSAEAMVRSESILTQRLIRET